MIWPSDPCPSLFDVFSSWTLFAFLSLSCRDLSREHDDGVGKGLSWRHSWRSIASAMWFLGQRWCKFSLFVPSFGDWMSTLRGFPTIFIGNWIGGAVEPESPGMNRSNTTVSFASFKRRRRSSIHFTWLWNWGIMRCLDAWHVCWHPLFSHKLHLKTNPSAKVVELIHTRWAFISHKGGEISL